MTNQPARSTFLVGSPSGHHPASTWNSRRHEHIRRNALIVAWIVVGCVAALMNHCDSCLHPGGWFVVHALLLGAMGSAITIWSAHFASTLLRLPARGGPWMIDGRLVVHTVGAGLVLAGVSTQRTILTIVGAALVMLNVLLAIYSMIMDRRQAVGARFGALVSFYVVAWLWCLLGVVVGVTMTSLARAGHASAIAPLAIAHVSMMIHGFMGMTVWGTLVLLWPTMLRTRMEEHAPLRARKAAVAFSVGTAMSAVSGWFAWLSLAGGFVVLIGVAFIMRDAVAALRRQPITTLATAASACAGLWYIWSTLTLAIMWSPYVPDAAHSSAVTRLVPALVLGTIVQIILGSLSYLLPVMLGGGPAHSRRTNAMMNHGWPWVVMAYNAGIVAMQIHAPHGAWRLLPLLTGVAIAVIVGKLVAITWVTVRRRTKPVSPEGSSEESHVNRRWALMGLVSVGGVALTSELLERSRTAEGLNVTEGTGGQYRVEITIDGMRFNPPTIDVPSGSTVLLDVTNHGDQVHDLFIDGQSTGYLSPGHSGQITLTDVHDSLTGWCTVPGHRAMGMELQVSVDGHAHADHTQQGGMDDDSWVNWQATPPPGWVAHDPYAPVMRPDPTPQRHDVTMTVSEMVVDVGCGIEQRRMMFNGSVPGPTLRGKIGDTFVITLINDGTMSHSIDFHAGITPPNRDMRSIDPGQSLTYTFTADHAGIWLYHCSTAPMSFHLSSGMYGAVIIDPIDLPEVDQEFVMVQSEIYAREGSLEPDARRIASATPTLMAFNGYPFQYVHVPVSVNTGQRIRIWVLDAGPSLPCSFHVVGGQFDTVFREGRWVLGGPEKVAQASGGASQALDLQPAQGGFVELTLPEAGDYPFVTHAFNLMEKGAKGVVSVR